MSAKTIKIAGRDFALPELPLLGQIKRISMQALKKRSVLMEEAEGQFFDSSVEMVSIALETVDKSMTPDFIYGSTVSLEELSRARIAIIDWAGLVRVEAPKSGEAPAGVGQTSTAD